MRDEDWEEQVMPADELIRALSKRFGAPMVHTLMPLTSYCLLCTRRTEFIGAYEVKDSIELYGLCHSCADLPDCIERVELRLLARAAARVN